MAVVTVVGNINNVTGLTSYQTALQKVKFDKPININTMAFYFNGGTTYDCAWVVYSSGFDRIYQSYTKAVAYGWNEFRFNSFLNLPAGTYYIGVTTAVNGFGYLTTMQGLTFQSLDITKDVGGVNVTVSPNVYSPDGTQIQTNAMLAMMIDGGIVNTAPSIPGSFTQPTGELESGDSKVFSVGSSSDAESNLSKYVWEASINGGSFTKIGETPTNNITYIIPTANSLKLRVKAVDSQGLESGYRESAVFTVTKPKYYWSKYNIVITKKYKEDSWSSPYDIDVRPDALCCSSYAFNTNNGAFSMSGAIINELKVGYYIVQSTGTVHVIDEIRWYDTNTGLYNVVVRSKNSVVDSSDNSKGTLIQSGIIAEEGTYPTDGVQSGYWWTRGSRVNQSIAPPGAFTSPEAGTVLKPGDKAVLAWGASPAPGVTSYEPERAFNEDGQFTIIGSVKSPNTTYGITTDKTKTKVQFRVRAYDGIKGILSDYIYSDIYTIQHNVIPTILLNTDNNFIMSETEGQNEVLVDGSARDTDANNNVIVKMQINDGTIRNIQSAISDGSTPIEFSKKITYSNKRVYDGETPLTNDLPENVDHKLKVWADDGQGGISTVEERTFRVIHNRPPVISGTDENLGELLERPLITYQVDDPEKQTATITERINGQVIRTFDAELGKEYKIEIPIEMWIPLQLEQEHKLTIEAKDTFGAKSTRTYTFTRTEDTILLELKNPFVTDIAATRILVTPDVYLPIGSTILIEACNNAFDEVPTWEDVTGMAMNKRGFHFTNTEKTAEQWGINIRFTLHKGTAHDQVRFNGFGGAFD
ncbi:hypothetical protein M3589_15045 [Heyndrickxia oleronia]|uniref:hypothetical protein n=1 Tax=Heyndrickxia oleronia TaxID=38875 RepID=UPI00203DB3D7|nr:hypothetical protein [Heyndrickxia oleronia]MCM3239039.1 hypothetical protein [Heyndrickxia oleronia]